MIKSAVQQKIKLEKDVYQKKIEAVMEVFRVEEDQKHIEGQNQTVIEFKFNIFSTGSQCRV